MNKMRMLHIFLGLSAMGGWAMGAQADIFVYQLPGGARIVTDHALDTREYKLVRHSKDTKGAGALVSSRKIAYAVTDPGAYDRLIRRTATANHVDVALVKAVMHVESAFNPHAVSDKGAQGLMQLMPETAQRYGAEDLFDPAQNVRAGVLYLKDLQRMFKNNTRLVLAAYNAGENAVLRHKGIPPYDETQDYVRKVMKMQRAYVAELTPPVKLAANNKPPVAHKLLPATTTAMPVVAATPAVTVMPAASTATDVVSTTPDVASILPVAVTQPTSDRSREKDL